MIHWKEVSKEVYHSLDDSDRAISRAKTSNGRFFIVIKGGSVKDIISDLFGGLK